MALGLGDGDLLPGAPVCAGSTGLTFLYVPLRDRAAVDRAVAEAGALGRVAGDEAVGTFLFAPDGPGRVYSRMFAPASGIPEDPATGSASGALIAYALAHGLVPAAAAGAWCT
jgi:trans-2,3-dihydro-3-hydroxyanthranilate isomerase